MGRVTVDLMQIIKDDKKPESNSLRFAAETFLDASLLKKDLSAQEMFDNFRSQDVSKMTTLLDYCIRDAEIPMKLIQKLSYMSTWIEMSRVTFTSLSQVLNGGQQRKVFNVIARFVHGEYVINKRPSGWPIEADLDDNLDLQDFDPMAKRKPD
jgi:DNA polymerase delta subunit 1